MRILIVSGHFTPGVGYQEVLLPRAYARLGHTVRVLTSTYIPGNIQNVIGIKRHQPGYFLLDDYEILRLRPIFRIGTAIFVNGISKVIKEFRPDLVIAVAIAKFMPLQVLLCKTLCDFKFISIFGDRYKDRMQIRPGLKYFVSAFFTNLFFTFVKRYWNIYALKKSDGVVFTTQETEHFILNKYKINGLSKKSHFIPLGYDENEFYFNLAERLYMRKKYNIKDDDFVIITATKIEPIKNIEKIIEILSKVFSMQNNFKMFLIGFGSNSYSEFIKSQIKKLALENNIICLPFAGHGELRQFFNAADLGIWNFECITIQEAMGTGLPVILGRTAVLSHLITEGINGYYYDDENQISQKIMLAYKKLNLVISKNNKKYESFRQKLMAINSKFSYKIIAQTILDKFTPLENASTRCNLLRVSPFRTGSLTGFTGQFRK